MVAPRALVFRPLVKEKEDSGNEIDSVCETAPSQQVNFKINPSRELVFNSKSEPNASVTD